MPHWCEVNTLSATQFKFEVSSKYQNEIGEVCWGYIQCKNCTLNVVDVNANSATSIADHILIVFHF